MENSYWHMYSLCQHLSVGAKILDPIILASTFNVERMENTFYRRLIQKLGQWRKSYYADSSNFILLLSGYLKGDLAF